MGFDPAVWAGDKDAEAYAKKRAARQGDKTDHGDLIASGSPDVLINNRPACRIELDAVNCQDDGREVVLTGADQVLINGKEAVREFDIFEGAGAPNPIAEGSDDVSIGETALSGGVGLDSDDVADEYCKRLCALLNQWNGLNEEQRRQGVQALVDWLNDRVGLKRSTVDWWGQDYAQFSGNDWTLHLPAGSLKKNRPELGPGEFGGNAYHETRHGEQQYYALKYRIAQQNRSNTPEDIAALRKQTNLPPDVIERALNEPRLEPGSREHRFGRQMDVWVYSGKGDVPPYERRANERDGRVVGYRGNCFNCC